MRSPDTCSLHYQRSLSAVLKARVPMRGEMRGGGGLMRNCVRIASRLSCCARWRWPSGPDRRARISIANRSAVTRQRFQGGEGAFEGADAPKGEPPSPHTPEDTVVSLSAALYLLYPNTQTERAANKKNQQKPGIKFAKLALSYHAVFKTLVSPSNELIFLRL